MLNLLAAALLAAAPAAVPPPTPEGPASGAELELLLSSVQPAQRPAFQTAFKGLNHLPLYRVVVRVEPSSHSFHGQEQLRVPLAAPTSELVLRLFANAKYLRGGKPAVDVSHVQCPAQTCALVPSDEPTLYRVAFNPPLPAGAVAAIDLAFDGEVPELPASAAGGSAALGAQMGLFQNRGGGPSDHGAFGAGEGVMALTGLFPQLAAHFGGSADTAAPSGIGDVASFDSSNYLVTAEVPADQTIVAGGTKVGEEATPDGAKRFTFAAAGVRDFPLYAGAWTATHQAAGPVQVTAYTLLGDEANGKIVLGIAARALTEFGKRFGAYPWTELSVVEQPLSDGAGGIEYPTVIGVASLVYRSQQSMGSLGALFGPQQKLGSHTTNVGFSDKLIEFAVAHEVAHQWWSSLVGSDPHQHPALDEALAQYSAVLYVESKRGKAASLEAQKTQVAVNFQMIRQSGEEDGAVDRPTEAFASPLQYAGLVYGKAPLFFPAARKLLGDAAFNQMLRRYADTHRLGEAGPGDLVRAGAAVAPAHARALEKLHARWFDEKHGDEDVGPMDMGALIEATTGLQISPQEKAMMQQLMPQLMQMMHDGADPAVVDPSGP